jgi:hypothetical protein
LSVKIDFTIFHFSLFHYLQQHRKVGLESEKLKVKSEKDIKMTELEIEEILKRIKKLEKENLALRGIEEDKSKAFSKVTTQYLKDLLKIKKLKDKNKFNSWFNQNILISKENNLFLQELLDDNEVVLAKFNEDTLKVKFIRLLAKLTFQVPSYSYQN